MCSGNINTAKQNRFNSSGKSDNNDGKQICVEKNYMFYMEGRKTCSTQLKEAFIVSNYNGAELCCALIATFYILPSITHFHIYVSLLLLLFLLFTYYLQSVYCFRHRTVHLHNFRDFSLRYVRSKSHSNYQKYCQL